MKMHEHFKNNEGKPRKNYEPGGGEGGWIFDLPCTPSTFSNA